MKKGQDLSAENHERTPVEINVARWSIFATHQTRGYRKLPPRTDLIDGQHVTRQVSIGTWRDTNKTLNPFDQDVFVTIYGQWERDGCDMNNRKVLGSISQTIFDLEDKKRRSNINEKEIVRIKESLDRMATISIIYDEAYENSSGYSTKTITLLKHVKVFDRKKSLARGDGYYEPTELELNEDICQNIKDKKFKLYYLHTLRNLPDIAKLIYTKLELYLGNIDGPFVKDVFELYFEISSATTAKRGAILRAVRRACAILQGKPITAGIIDPCRVEKKTNGQGWNLYADFLKVKKPMRLESARDKDKKHPSVKMADEIKKLRAQYDAMAQGEKDVIEKRKNDILKHEYKGFGESFALEDAIREHLGIKRIALLTFKEQACKNRYFGDADLRHISAILNPPRPPLLTYFPSIKPASN